MTVFGGLQYCSFVIIDFSLLCFNTDDGIRRATIGRTGDDRDRFEGVSIPMTVLGGLQ